MKIRSWLLSAITVLGMLQGTAPAQDPKAAAPAQAVMTAPVVYENGDGNGARGGFFAGAGFYILKPHFDNNPAYQVFVTTGGAGRNADQSSSNFDFTYDYSLSPVIWLGFANANGLGFRTRWFYFDQSADSIAFVNPDYSGATKVRTAAPLGLNIESPVNALQGGVGADAWVFQSDLKMVVWDFEAIQAINLDPWLLQIAAGIRYAHISQQYAASLAGQTGATIITGTVVGGHYFDGAGPTVAIDARRYLGRSNLSLYGQGRGSILFGEGRQTAQAILLIPGHAGPTDNDQARDGWDRVIPVAELELGVDWGREVGRGRVFLQLALVGQLWGNVGNAANNELQSADAALSNSRRIDANTDNKANLGLYGVKIATGLDY